MLLRIKKVLVHFMVVFGAALLLCAVIERNVPCIYFALFALAFGTNQAYHLSRE